MSSQGTQGYHGYHNTPSHGDQSNSNYQNNDNNYYYVSYNNDEQDNDQDDDYLPEGTMSIKELNDKPVALFGLCLFDSGSTSTLINERAIPPTVVPKIGPSQEVTITQGTYTSTKYFFGNEISFPEFCKTRYIR